MRHTFFITTEKMLSMQDQGAKEVATAQVGEWVMEALPALNEVAYVRFASVYRQFRDVNEFMAELKQFLGESDSTENM